MKRLSRPSIISLVAALGVAVVAGTASATAPTVFIDSPNHERRVAVDDGWQAWGADSNADKYAYRVWVSNGGPATAVTPKGSLGFTGNIELGGPHGNVLAYAVAARDGAGPARIKFYDLDTGISSDPPSGVNASNADQSDPSVSGDALLFDRGHSDKEIWSSAEQILLYRFGAQTFTELAHAPKGGWVEAGRVNGDFATYLVCPKTLRCNVFRYQLSTDSTVKVPLASGKANYYPTVTPDGTMYFVQGSPTKCGVGTSLLKRDPSGVITTTASFPHGTELGPAYTYDNGVFTTLYFTKIACARFKTSIYQLPV